MKESVFNVMVVILLLLSAMVGTIESVGLALTIQSPQSASANGHLNFTTPFPFFGTPAERRFFFDKSGFMSFSAGMIDMGFTSSSNRSVEYGDVAVSDYPVINQHVAAYGVTGFTTTYAYLIKWTYPTRPTLRSETLFATNGAQTYFSTWHPGASNATTAGMSFRISGEIGNTYYYPDNETIYVFKMESSNYTRLSLVPTTTSATTTSTTTTPGATSPPLSSSSPVITTTTTFVQQPSRNSATKLSSSADTVMLLVALFFPTIAASSFAL